MHNPQEILVNSNNRSKFLLNYVRMMDICCDFNLTVVSMELFAYLLEHKTQEPFKIDLQDKENLAAKYTKSSTTYGKCIQELVNTGLINRINKGYIYIFNKNFYLDTDVDEVNYKLTFNAII